MNVSLIAAEGGRILAERVFSDDETPEALPTDHKLILEMGSPLEFGSAIRFSEEGEPEGTTIVHLDDPSAWPDRSCGYAGVDYVVLTTSDPKIYERISQATFAALERWVQLGGRLVMSVGLHGPELIAPDAPLARFSPGRFAGTTALNRFGALESFARTGEPLDAARVGPRRQLDAARLEDVQGQVLAYEGERPTDLPLIAHRGLGFGEVTFVAVDLDLPPLSRWPARAELLAALLGRDASLAAARPGGGGAGQGMLGFDDLSGQLRAAIDRFPGVRLTPFWLVAMLGIGYVLLLFPVDYLLRRMTAHHDTAQRADGLVRGALPWLRLTVWIVAASVGIGLLGARWKSERVELSSAEVVDFDVETGLARGNDWFSVYCPSSQIFDLKLAQSLPIANSQLRAAELSWLGLPGADWAA